MRRREFLERAAVGTLAAGLQAAESQAAGEVGAPRDRVAEIRRETIFRHRDGGVAWFSTRACMRPGTDGPIALMMMGEITGSDYFGPVHVTESSDLGKTWSPPQPIPGLGRKRLADGVEEGSCDWVPEYHAATGTTLAMGHDVFYKGGRFFTDQPPRHSVYTVRDASGRWLEPRRFVWDDPRGKFIYTCNCAQRATLDDGDVVVPLSFGPRSNARSVATVRCSFDGRDLVARQVGDELKNAKGRGFLEPSIARHQGRFYLTIRAEDDRGYVAVGDDGLAWSKPVVWAWDDGQPLTMSTTQQRWLPHGDELYLVYTRKAEENVNVIRWRAPLYMALVDRRTLRLVRASERIAVPLAGDGVARPSEVPHLGNFHTTAATADESWITVGEMNVKNFRGDVQLARVRWTEPNQAANEALTVGSSRRPASNARPSGGE